MPEFEPQLAVRVAQGLDRQEGATIDRRDAVRRTRNSWVDLLKREAVPAATQAVAREEAIAHVLAVMGCGWRRPEAGHA